MNELGEIIRAGRYHRDPRLENPCSDSIKMGGGTFPRILKNLEIIAGKLCLCVRVCVCLCVCVWVWVCVCVVGSAWSLILTFSNETASYFFSGRNISLFSKILLKHSL